MHTHDEHPVDDRPTGLSRRTLIGAGAAAAVGAGLAGTIDGRALAAPAMPRPMAITAPTPGLVYVTLDAFAFHVADTASTTYRLYDELTGMQPQPAARYIQAPLTIPIGSVVKEISVGYQVQPIVSIARRSLTGAVTDLTTPTSLAAGGGAKSQTLAVDAELTHGATYSVRAFCSAGDSIYGMVIGYVPAAQAFIPYAGTTPRVLDTRPNNRLGADQEIVVDLSNHLIPTARAAVINLTAVNVGGPGFLAAFADGITWPGNSSVNFTAAGQIIANSAVVTMTDGKIRVRAGATSSHVLVDVVGSLL